MMKKMFLCLLLLGFITGCSKSYDEHSSNHFISPDPNTKPTETVKNDNDFVQNKADTEKPKKNSNDSHPEAIDVTSFIPAGWHILEHDKPVKAEGDLNKDDIKDIAIVIEKTQESLDAPRSLLIAFGTKEDTFALSIIAEHVVLPASEGGGYGDPFDGLSIDRGSVIVSDFGGSSERWYDKYRFRFQDNDWYLIGATSGSNFPVKDGMDMGNDEDDYNLLTGDFISRRTNENGEEKVTKGNRGKKKLIKLREFDISEIGASLCQGGE